MWSFRRGRVLPPPRVAVVPERAFVHRDRGRDFVVERRQQPQRMLDAHRLAVVRERRTVVEDVIDSAEVAADGGELQIGKPPAVGDLPRQRLVILDRKSVV